MGLSQCSVFIKTVDVLAKKDCISVPFEWTYPPDLSSANWKSAFFTEGARHLATIRERTGVGAVVHGSAAKYRIAPTDNHKKKFGDQLVITWQATRFVTAFRPLIRRQRQELFGDQQVIFRLYSNGRGTKTPVKPTERGRGTSMPHLVSTPFENAFTFHILSNLFRTQSTLWSMSTQTVVSKNACVQSKQLAVLSILSIKTSIAYNFRT